MFVRGTDGAIWRKAQYAPNSGWNPWTSLGGTLGGRPTVGQNADGRLEVFAHTPSGTVWQNWQLSPAGGYSGWYRLGDAIAGESTVALRREGYLELIARRPDDAIWSTAQSSSGWTPWTSRGGWVEGDPAAVNAGGHAVFFFVRGFDGELYFKLPAVSPPFLPRRGTAA